MRKFLKPIFIALSSIALVLILMLLILAFIYLKFIPFLVQNDKFISFAQDKIGKMTDTVITLKQPKLNTSITPVISLSFKTLKIDKDNKEILNVENFETKILFKKILKKKILVKKLGADYIFADVNSLQELNFDTDDDKTDKKSDWKIGLFSSLLYIKDCLIIYETDDGFKVNLKGSNIEIAEQRNPKPVRFNFVVDMEKNNQKFTIKFNDNNTVFTNEKQLYAQNTELFVNNSKVLINYKGKEDKTFEVNLHTKNFDFNDVSKLLNSNIFIPNGSELLALTTNIHGKFDFDININNNEMNGNVKVNRLSFNVPLVNDIPVVITNGNVILDKNDITLKDFKGYHGKHASNKIDFSGKITDYTKGINASILASVDLSKEFTTDYISKMINYPIELVGKTKAKVKVNMVNDLITSTVVFRLKKNENNILLDGSSLTPMDLERAFKADVKLQGNNLELSELNYYIARTFKVGAPVKPILKLKGNFDLANNGAIKNLGFEIPRPLPSEILNVLLRARVFRKGKISGSLNYIATSKIPYLDGNLKMDGVRIPAQRMSIHNAELKSNNNNINLYAKGRFKRAPYTFTSVVLNEIKTPFVVKDINLKIDDIDIDRVMKTFTTQPQTANADLKTSLETTSQQVADTNSDDGDVAINTDFIVIKHGLFEITKGVYKVMDFANVKATMTLDKNGVLDIVSNKFDIAKGTSSAKINCNLKKQLYTIKLGIKDTDADILSTALLNLPNEVSGKARGLIFLETDKKLKLNGKMLFDIKNGNIAKVGLIEYALNFASVFRNPLAMISPATFFDIVNIPEGEFEWIKGQLTLKDNVIQRMMIKSSAPNLSSFIVGRYDLEKSDATLRIYTKISQKNKGVAGFLRNLSLSALANKMPLNSRNDSNYYSAEISMIPELTNAENEKNSQIFLTKLDGDVEHNNFLSTLKKIK